MRGLTCGELASGSDEPAQRMARGDVGREVQQQSPLGFPHPQLHMVGVVGASAWLIKTGTVAGNTSTRARITEVPRDRPESNVIDSSIDNRYRLFNSTTITSILRDKISGGRFFSAGRSTPTIEANMVVLNGSRARVVISNLENGTACGGGTFFTPVVQNPNREFSTMTNDLTQLRIGITLSLITLLFGFGLCVVGLIAVSALFVGHHFRRQES